MPAAVVEFCKKYGTASAYIGKYGISDKIIVPIVSGDHGNIWTDTTLSSVGQYLSAIDSVEGIFVFHVPEEHKSKISF